MANKKNILIAGVDEVGRGALAGPVVAAAIILPAVFNLSEIQDSKNLSTQKISRLAKNLRHNSIAYGIGEVPAPLIDELNILKATWLAMNLAVWGLQCQPDEIWVDGPSFQSYLKIPFRTFVRGDSEIPVIGAASIIAKDHRDNLMMNLDHEHPQFGWQRNKGYSTRQHRQAIQNFGLTAYHRKTFNIQFD